MPSHHQLVGAEASRTCVSRGWGVYLHSITGRLTEVLANAIGLVDGNAGLEQLPVQAGILHCLVGNERVEGPAGVGALAGDVHLRQKEEACQRIARFA